MEKISTDDVVSTYKRYAPLYDFLFGAVLSPGRKKMAAAVMAFRPNHLLEVGVGTGLALKHYPAKSKIIGIDISAEMLERAQIQANRLALHDISLHVMNAEDLGFEDDTFDCVTVPYVLSVTPDPNRLIAELRRVCRPGGHIIIVNHFSGSGFWWAMEHLVSSFAAKIGFHSEFDYREHIEAHDWTVEAVTRVNLLGLSRLVVIRNG